MGDRTIARHWLVAIIVLLGTSIFINYIDRGNLSTAAPIIKEEFHLSASQLGFLLTSFFITYTVMHPVAGCLVDRLQASRVLLVGFAIWSLATIFTGLASTFFGLFVIRLVLGAGEAVAFPSCWKIICRCFSETQRGLANAVLTMSTASGTAFGILFGGLLIASFGWRAFFIGFGLVSLFWIVPWLIVGSKCTTEAREIDASGPTFRTVLSVPSLWAMCLAHSGGAYVWYFILTWIPYYLVQERHWSLREMAVIAATAYLFTGIGTMMSGWLADRWIHAGASPTLARKTFLFAGLAGAASCMIGCVASDATHSVIFLILSGLSWGTAAPHVWATAQTVAGPQATGKWTGIQNAVGSVSGIVAPALTGVLVDQTGNFLLPFLVAAAMATMGAFTWIFLVGPIVQIDWSSRPAVVPRIATISP